MTQEQNVLVAPALGPLPRALHVWRTILRFARRKPLGAFGAFLIIVILATALLAGSIETHDPARTSPAERLRSPSAEHLHGTDNLGRDIFSRVVHGARVSAIVGPLAVVLAVTIATLFGGVTGFIGGRVDLAAQRLVDMCMAFPALIILISAVQLLPSPTGTWHLLVYDLGPVGQRGLYLILVLGIVLSFGMSRLLRSSVLGVKSSLYVEAARSMGASEGRIFLRHVLPNIMPIVLVVATFSLGSAILIEASTSFLGVGLPPEVPSWGRMLSEGRVYVDRSVNITIWPGLAIALAVFGFNMLGDALRDELDPRLRGSR